MAEMYTLEQIRAAYWRARNRDLGPAASPTWAEIAYELCPRFSVREYRFGSALRWSVVLCNDRALCYCAEEHEAQRIANALNAMGTVEREGETEDG